MTKVTKTVYGALLNSQDIPKDVQAALRELVENGRLQGFLLVTYGKDPVVNWRAKPTDVLNTIMTLVELVTDSSEISYKVGDLVVSNMKLPDSEMN